MPKSHYDSLLGQIFLHKSFLNEKQLSKSIQYAQSKGLKIASAIVELDYAKEREALECLTEQTGIPGINFGASIFKVLPSIIPYQVALKKMTLPIKITDTNLFVAVSNPFDKVLLDELSFITGKKVIAYIAIETVLIEAIRMVFRISQQDSQGYYLGDNANFTSGLNEQLDIVTPVVLGFEETEEDDSYLIVGELVEEEPFQSDIIDVDALLSSPKKVVVVDDEPDILKLITKVVKKLKMEAMTATNGSDALPLITNYKPDLIILDAMLPGMHGFEICKKLKSSDLSYIPVLIISAIYKGWQFEKDIIDLYKADRFLEKPFRINLLMQTIQELLNEPVENKSDKDQPNIDIIVKKIIQFIQLKKFSEARKIIEKASKTNPFSHQLKYLSGHLYLMTKNNYLAINELEATLEINRRFYSAAKELAITYEKMGFRNKAIEKWQIVFELTENRKLKKQIKDHLIKLVSNTPV